MVDAVANEKGVPQGGHFRRDGSRARLGSEEALSRAGRRRARRDRSRSGDYETFRRWEVVAGRRRHGIARSPDPPDGRGRREARHRRRRVHRGADRESRIRPHRGAGRQAGHRAARARSRARAGRRCVQGSRRRADHRHRQARRARQHLSRSRRQCRGVRAARSRDSARIGARRRSRARLSLRSEAPNCAGRSCSSRAPRRSS